MNRDSMLAQAEDRSIRWDVVIIGGGATGLGTALDAAGRGYRTLLLEGADFAKGTSSRSTKLIHGGVRYLRQGQVGMVRHSLRERGLLLENAAPLVHPLRFVIPAYRRGERWYYFAGLKAYDLLAGKQNVGASSLLSAEKTAELLPTLKTDGLRGGVAYSDAQFDDAGLALRLAQAAARRGATLLNYAPVVRLDRDGGKLRGVVFADQESGKEIAVAARGIVNATGVFSESILRLDGTEEQNTAQENSAYSRPRLVPSQGSHLVLGGEFLGTDHAILIPDTDDGRVLFAIPWLGSTLLGTTDIPVPDVVRDPMPSASEIDYLLQHAGRYLRTAPQRKDIQSMFAGLRPLVDARPNPGPSKSTSTARMTREHLIDVSPSGLISVIGGKWTTYRQMGQEVVDLASRLSGLQVRPSTTRHEPLDVAGDDHAPNLNQPPTQEQIAAYVTDVMARTVEDVLARRSRLLFVDARRALEAAPAVAVTMRRLLNRDDHWVAQQLEAFNAVACQFLPPASKM